jgi:anaerobic selenocysteine-containing dehydrogenase
VPAEGEARSSVEVFAELLRRLSLHREGEPLTSEALSERILGSRPAPGGPLVPACGAHPVQFVDVFPNTPDAKIHLVPPELDEAAPQGLYAYREVPAGTGYPLALISPATSATVSSTFGQCSTEPAAVDIHPQDAAARGIVDRADVRLWSDLGEVRCRARVTNDVRPGVLMLPKGLWQRSTASGTTANALAPDHLADLGGGACFNDARVEIELDSKDSTTA